MADRKGDQEKQPSECFMSTTGRCPHIAETGGDFEREVYNCAVCGERYTLYYEDMK